MIFVLLVIPFIMSSLFHSFLSKVRDSLASSVHNRLYYDVVARELLNHALTSSSTGVSIDSIADTEVVVSLTTHGKRVYEVYLAIESIMQGSVKPNRIVLWLSHEFQNTVSLPSVLTNQINRGLEIKYVEDLGPYTKSVPAFRAFPDATIITIDDDILYPYDTVEMLLSMHASHSNMICANRVMNVTYDKYGRLTSVPSWKELEDKTRVSRANFFEGVGGVLYPSNCFDAVSLNSDLFLHLCPSADDVWFNVQSVRQNISIVPANMHYLRFPLLINESVQDLALWRQNNCPENTQNDKQLRAVLDYFHLKYVF